MGLIDFLQANWAAVMAAPWAFVTLAVIVGGGGLAIGRLWQSGVIANLESIIKLRDEEKASLEKKVTGQQAVIETLRQPDDLADKVRELTEAVDAYARPREVSQKQYQALIDYLLPREKFEIDVCFNHGDDEAGNYASRLRAALNEAGWTAGIKASLDGKLPTGEQLQTGLRIVYGFNGPQQKSHLILGRALEMARIMVQGGGGGNTMGKPEYIFLSVGRRPFAVMHEGPPPSSD